MGSDLSWICKALTIFSIILSCSSCQSQLSSNFYDNTCPNALPTIQSAIRKAISRDRGLAASLIRLHFHDCFVQGCDGSILLDDTPLMAGEKFSIINNNSLRGYKAIDDAKAQVESICPRIVSCADIIAVAARDASVIVGGPSWEVNLGRRDSTTASRSLADANLPTFADSLERLISLFASKGLNAREMVALSGSHTIGQAQCSLFRDRIYDNASDIDAGFAKIRRRNCPANKGIGDRNFAPLDVKTPNYFDNDYFKDLIRKKGLLQSDQILFSGGFTDKIVEEYSKNLSIFRSDFASAMVRMGDIEPLTGSQGVIRRRCNVIN